MKTARRAPSRRRTAAVDPLADLAPESRPALELVGEARFRAPWDQPSLQSDDISALVAIAGHGGAHAGD